MRLYYDSQAFFSHSRTAMQYRFMLSNLCTLVQDPADADVTVLHHEPPYYAKLLERMPALRNVYRIGYCTWEADRLPDEWAAHVGLMDELWVPSAYCHAAFSAVHPRVRWLPHVALCLWRNTPETEATLRAQLTLPDDAFVFLNFTHAGIKRKNLPGLLAAFEQVAREIPRARLVIKVTPNADGPTTVEHAGAVTFLHGFLDPAPLHSFYGLADVYVSAHHAEGWGLPLSDAMLCGKPVVASGYSGNLDFMTPHNSYLVRAPERPVATDEEYYLFKAPLRWGGVDTNDLAEKMLAAYRDCQSGAACQRVDEARRNIALYDAAHVAPLVRELVVELRARLQIQ